jgi:hypothetical protein
VAYGTAKLGEFQIGPATLVAKPGERLVHAYAVFPGQDPLRLFNDYATVESHLKLICELTNFEHRRHADQECRRHIGPHTEHVQIILGPFSGVFVVEVEGSEAPAIVDQREPTTDLSLRSAALALYCCQSEIRRFVPHQSPVKRSLTRKGDADQNAMAARRFDPQPLQVPAARAFVREFTRGLEQAEEVELVASELVTNAIRHAITPFEVSIHIAPQQIRLEVTDASPTTPMPYESAGPRHGLHIVAVLADRWGVDAVDGGKTVWAEFSTE